MANIANDPNGFKRICFTNLDGEPKAIRLGKATVKAAASFCLRVEEILSNLELNHPHDAQLCGWLNDLSPKMHKRLVKAGLAKPRAEAQAVTLGGLMTAFFAGAAVKPATLVRMKQAEATLVSHFSESRDVETIGEADADEWRASLTKAGYASATISRTVLYARQIFKWAIRRGMAKANPFSELKAGSQANTARAVFVSRESIAKVIDAAPDAEWRLLIALSRFGGLRVPSEALALRWSDVDWEHNRLTIRSCKTEHHEGKGERIIPLFAEIREHLQAVYDAAPVGSVTVIGRYREGANLNPHFRRIIKRAGLIPWEKTWHNLRASRQTELAADFPLHTVCAWIGNTKAIAAGHYLQVTDADWSRATADPKSGAKSGAPTARKAAQHGAAELRSGSPEGEEEACFSGAARPDASECETGTNAANGQSRT